MTYTGVSQSLGNGTNFPKFTDFIILFFYFDVLHTDYYSRKHPKNIQLFSFECPGQHCLQLGGQYLAGDGGKEEFHLPSSSFFSTINTALDPKPLRAFKFAGQSSFTVYRLFIAFSQLEDRGRCTRFGITFSTSAREHIYLVWRARVSNMRDSKGKSSVCPETQVHMDVGSEHHTTLDLYTA
jgi:hypothetical protein